MNLFCFAIDGFRIVQVIVAVLVFGFSLIFAKQSFKDLSKRFYISAFITLLATVGIFLSASLLTLFFFFEIMSFASYFWLLEKNSSRKISNLYLAVSVISGMIMLMGLFLLNNELGTLVISEIEFSNTTTAYVAGTLTLVGFCTKAGLYPLHIWLPDTYFEAPAPATTMFSAVLSKLGVFGAIIVSVNVFGSDENWGKVMLVFAIITMLWAGACAIVSTDMKKTIAYSSMSQIGFIFFGLAMFSILEEHKAVAVNGMILHIVNHSLFKTILFTICGVILLKIGSTKLDKIRGLARRNIVVAISFVVAACGLAGVPFVSGYVSKTLLHESVVEQIHLSHDPIFTVFEYLFLIAGGLTTCYMLKIGVVLFEKPKDKTQFKLPVFVSFSLIVFSLISIVAGVLPNLVMDSLVEYCSSIFNAEHLHESINYFSFVNLQGSIISLSIGLVLYFVVYRSFAKKRTIDEIIPDCLKLKKIYEQIFIKDLCYIVVKISIFLDKYFVRIVITFLYKILEIYSFVSSRIIEFIAETLLVFGFAPSKRPDTEDRTTNSYKVGKGIDKVLAVVGIKMQNSIANNLSRLEQQSALRRRMISSSLSYGLFFAGVGIIALLVYMLIMI